MDRAAILLAMMSAALPSAACGGRATAAGATVTLRDGCGSAARWNGDTCEAWAPEVFGTITENEARILGDPQTALTTLEDVVERGPFEHGIYVRIWRQRGMAHSLLSHAAAEAARDGGGAEQAAAEADHAAAAMAAFDMLLALDPGHRLEYTQTPQTTFMFQDAIALATQHPAPALEVDWQRGLRVGDPIPVAVEVIADPKSFLARATLFVRTRGETAWQAADLALPQAGGYQRLVLPPVDARAATALELYVRAYDLAGNEVLEWASPERPRELPLRWDPPTPWYRTWWIWALAGGAVAAGVGVTVYATQWDPSATVGGDVTVDWR